MLPSPGAWVIDGTATFNPPNGATLFISTLPIPHRRVGHIILDSKNAGTFNEKTIHVWALMQN